MSKKDNLLEAREIVVNMTRLIAVRRSLGSENQNPHLNFWKVIYGSLTDNIVLEWCKMFGSRNIKHQKLHWSNIFSEDRRFQEQLLATLGVSEAAWKDYWGHMKKYRDQHVAHRDPSAKEIKEYPHLDYALLSGDLYYTHLIQELEYYRIYSPTKSMTSYYIRVFEHSQDVARILHHQTKDLRELVG